MKYFYKISLYSLMPLLMASMSPGPNACGGAGAGKGAGGGGGGISQYVKKNINNAFGNIPEGKRGEFIDKAEKIASKMSLKEQHAFIDKLGELAKVKELDIRLQEMEKTLAEKKEEILVKKKTSEELIAAGMENLLKDLKNLGLNNLSSSQIKSIIEELKRKIHEIPDEQQKQLIAILKTDKDPRQKMQEAKNVMETWGDGSGLSNETRASNQPDTPGQLEMLKQLETLKGQNQNNSLQYDSTQSNSLVAQNPSHKLAPLMHIMHNVVQQTMCKVIPGFEEYPHIVPLYFRNNSKKVEECCQELYDLMEKYKIRLGSPIELNTIEHFIKPASSPFATLHAELSAWLWNMNSTIRRKLLPDLMLHRLGSVPHLWYEEMLASQLIGTAIQRQSSPKAIKSASDNTPVQAITPAPSSHEDTEPLAIEVPPEAPPIDTDELD